MAEVTAAELAGALGGELIGSGEVAPEDVAHDSGSVRGGSLFCCVVGAHHDGHDHAREAVERGAVALLCSRPLPVDVTQVVVPDVRSAMGPASSMVYGRPSDSLRIVGVTGTNGKTTVVTMLGEVLRRCGLRCEVMGTLTGARTTPEAPELQGLLAGWSAGGVTHVAMEVSSHALAQHRVDGTRFAVGVFTNLGDDHLDFHANPEDYFAAKARLFEPGRCEVGVLNLDDVHGRLLRDAAAIPTVGYSLQAAEGLELGPRGSRFRWRGRDVRLGLPGAYNVSNALAVAESASLLGIEDDDVAAALSEELRVPGRFELVPTACAATVVVDYAHTPDALRSVLTAARALVDPLGRLLVVFGCGGDRDAGKRPTMGRVATELADLVVVTNDNPRSEDPLRIIEEIRTGCLHDPVVLPDRRSAIRFALEESGAGDLVLIAGKGHEAGQETAGLVEAFDDRLVAAHEARSVCGQEGSAGPCTGVGEGRPG